MISLHSIPLAATTADDLGRSHSVMDALPHLAGMVMVLIALTSLWCLTSIVAKLVSIRHSMQQPEPAPVTKASAPASTAPAADQDASPEIVAIISAAIACMHGGSRRVISIKPADTSWEKAGRHSVLSSHRIR